ncbi:Trp biosynthesis-associated membrane protein [Spelaeicoccus albus]|uniref:Glucan phosphoethanolaminetransferase (Alkaline phosphatase superfamily) n=1 Tax=Spelaeicoccus albus TaxID=1280376 RepID=A0A7Z0IIL7_9MICO|nr:Trp biosynthesis-associated membrane protein [Spelaeicoccus albus]NYI68584.1 glucan phosphoethanolaminetransferase (alkaline phosphatase superfamily) [Spelaeicoccus albus]
MTPGRQKAVAVAALLLLAGALFVVSGRTWLTAEASSPVGATSAVAVTGTQATAVLPAVAAALAAAALALSIARTVARIIITSIMIVLSGAWIATAAAVAARPGTAASAQVRDTTGLAESGEHAQLTAWPVVGIVLAAFVVLACAAVLVAGRRWTSGGTRFERAGAHDPVGDARGGPKIGQEFGQESGTESGTESGADDDQLDPSTTWDALTRGDDPS